MSDLNHTFYVDYLGLPYWPRWGTFFGGLLYGLLNPEEIGHSFTDQFTSWDPNDIIGPVGFGPEGFLTGDFPLPYTIRFENLDAATAPAAEVIITQQLDPDLDFTTFELGEFGIGELFVSVPAGRDFYSTRLDLLETHGVFVDVTAGINVLSGLATWTFMALDPNTFDLPIDPLVGFLPPNQTSPEGEGFVTYTIRTKAGLPTGTRIDAEARIFFDLNDPIDTPAIFNTTDSGAPASAVTALPTSVPAGEIIIAWSGQDDVNGSGIQYYDLYASIDDGPFELFASKLTSTSTIFVGEAGHKYSFFTVAVDNVGHAESKPLTPDASVLVTVGSNTGSIAGRLFNDINANGQRDIGEPLLAGRTVFIDLNNNQLLDSGERQTATDSFGNYLFDELEPGQYTIAQIIPLDWHQTLPLASSQLVTLAINEQVTAIAFASRIQTWQNLRQHEDVNDDLLVSAIDVLLIINYLNSEQPGALPPAPSRISPPQFLDVNGDDFVSPIDVLLVINYINNRNAGEGEIDRNEPKVWAPPFWLRFQNVGSLADRPRREQQLETTIDRSNQKFGAAAMQRIKSELATDHYFAHMPPRDSKKADVVIGLEDATNSTGVLRTMDLDRQELLPDGA